MPLLPEYSLAGRVALLATSDGDEAPLLAQALAEGGASVFVIARQTAQLDTILHSLKQAATPGDHGGIAVNLATSEGLNQATEALDRQHSQVDILVNDARSMLAKPFIDITAEEWEELHSRNLRSTFNICQAVGRRMLARGYGRIVNVAKPPS